MSSYLGALDLAANVCLFNFITIIFMLPMGISFSSTALVGIQIGKGAYKIARIITMYALATGVSILVCTTILVFLFRNYIPYAYTTEVDVAELVTKLLQIYCCFGILDGIQMILHGVIKGIGKQAIASIICLLVLYPINIPLAYLLAWPCGYGLFGLWYSQIISILLLNTSYITILYFNDWKQISKDVKHKMNIETHRTQLRIKQMEENKNVV
jgi:MATE family multidrug resistance protein